MTESTNKRIAKNTLFLYFRMILTIIVLLYTSRVVLKVLGAEDFGIYQVVGGIVIMLSFLNSALSNGTSRFLTYELGAENLEKLKQTFSTTLIVHIFLAIIIIVLAESVGLWFLYNKVPIPSDRLEAALWVYHFSVLTTVVTITQVPYNASIISHENMKIYAYVSVFDAIMKLGIAFSLQFLTYDKLKLYAVLLFLVQLSISIFYRYYCTKKYKETRFKIKFNKEIFISITRFSSWSLLSNLSIALNTQGTSIITNMFFGPVVVTSRAISVQVNMAINQFINNFRTAVNPQIVKKQASGDFLESRKMLLSSTKYSFYLMLLLGLPAILLADPILYLWLGEVPKYSVIFLQLIIIQSFFSVFDTSFYTALYSIGRLKENALISPLLGFIRFPIVYILFKQGFSPVALSYAGIISYFILGILVKPILLCKIANYTPNDILSVFYPCLKVAIFAIPFPVSIFYALEKNALNYFFILLISIICVIVAVYVLGIDINTRKNIRRIFYKKIKDFFVK